MIYFRLRKGESRGGVFKEFGGVGHRNSSLTLGRETLGLRVTEKGEEHTDRSRSEDTGGSGFCEVFF